VENTEERSKGEKIMRSAFLVHFPKKTPSPFNQGNYQFVQSDDGPILVVAMNISDVAADNKSAIKIEKIDCRDVLIDELVKETFKEKKP
jgi:hypothetical protein